MTFGKKLRKIREDKGLTVTELAEKAHLSQPTVSQYENGDRNPHPNMKMALALALGVKPSALDDDREDVIENGNET